MALPSIVFKAELQIADMDRNYYQTHTVTLTRHSSETDERMMMRLVAFAMNAQENLSFANGLTSQDEPDIWEKDFSGDIVLWLMVGLPDEKQIKKACSRSQQVKVYAYGNQAVVEHWRRALKLEKFERLSVYYLPSSISQALTGLTERSMKVQCTIQDGVLWWSSKDTTLEIELISLNKDH